MKRFQPAKSFKKRRRLRSCTKEPKFVLEHEPFTIHHSPFTIHGASQPIRDTLDSALEQQKAAQLLHISSPRTLFPTHTSLLLLLPKPVTPFYRPLYTPQSHSHASSLLSLPPTFCKVTQRHSPLSTSRMPPQKSLASTSAKRIAREINDINKKDGVPAGCTCGPINAEVSLYEWSASIVGPEGSPYEGGVFDLHITLPPDFPFRAPKVFFKTKVYHANINHTGGICLDILKNSWSPALSIVKVLLSISSLLVDPNPHDPLVPEIAQRFLKDREGHDKTAREWTKKYAQPPPGSALEKKTGEGSKSKTVEVITID